MVDVTDYVVEDKQADGRRRQGNPQFPAADRLRPAPRMEEVDGVAGAAKSACNMPKSGAKRFACGRHRAGQRRRGRQAGEGVQQRHGQPEFGPHALDQFRVVRVPPAKHQRIEPPDPPGSAANWFCAVAIVRRISAMRAGRGGRSPAKRVVRRKTVLPSLMTVRSVSSAKSSISSCGFPSRLAASSDAVSQGRSRIRRRSIRPPGRPSRSR